jgi:hypothetical protein
MWIPSSSEDYLEAKVVQVVGARVADLDTDGLLVVVLLVVVLLVVVLHGEVRDSGWRGGGADIVKPWLPRPRTQVLLSW